LLGEELLRRAQLIVDLQLALVRVQSRHLDHPRRQVDAADVGAMARQRFGEQAAAAADIEHAPLRQRAALRDVGDTRRIERVQRLEGAARIPEFMRQRSRICALPRPSPAPSACCSWCAV
jgi:hypothetical protein